MAALNPPNRRSLVTWNVSLCHETRLAVAYDGHACIAALHVLASAVERAGVVGKAL